MQQGVIPLVCSFSHFLLPLLSSKLVLEKDQNESLEKDGFDYNFEDRPWQRDENEKKPETKKKMIRQFGRKNAIRKKRVGRKKDAQHQRGLKQKEWGKGNSRGGKTKRNRKGKGKTSMKHLHLQRRKERWGRGKNRNRKTDIQTTGKGWKSKQKRKGILNRKGGKEAFRKVNLAVLRQLQEKEKTMRSFFSKFISS